MLSTGKFEDEIVQDAVLDYYVTHGIVRWEQKQANTYTCVCVFRTRYTVKTQLLRKYKINKKSTKEQINRWTSELTSRN